jgi:hypothetical protein
VIDEIWNPRTIMRVRLAMPIQFFGSKPCRIEVRPGEVAHPVDGFVFIVVRDIVEEDEEDPLQLEERTVDGRNVLAGFDPEDDLGGYLFIYAWEDVLFTLSATDQELAEAALVELP